MAAKAATLVLSSVCEWVGQVFEPQQTLCESQLLIVRKQQDV